MPNLGGGGAESVAVKLANGFAQRGHLVEMVLLSASGEFLVDLRNDIRIVDLRARRLRWVLPQLVGYLRMSRPNALLACMWPLTVIALWAQWFARIPLRVIVSEHTTWSRDEIASSFLGRWKVSSTMHRAFPRANGIVCVSRGSADDLARFARIRNEAITVIYNPVVGADKVSRDEMLAPADWWTGQHRRIIAVGALKSIKDYATLLTAFALLRRLVNVRLLILGEGDCRLALEGQVKQLGLEGSVFMPGFVKDTSPYYQHADLFVLSSSGEGFGNVIVEALDAGTPVVSTDCQSGPREILSDGQFGRLVPVGNAAALAAAMADSLDVKHDRAALKARAQYFSINRAVDQYLELLLPTYDQPEVMHKHI